MTPAMKDAYWQLGWHAWVDGKSRLLCPFPDGSARESWMTGYDDARAALFQIKG
jgi:ribosome modulation factor